MQYFLTYKLRYYYYCYCHGSDWLLWICKDNQRVKALIRDICERSLENASSPPRVPPALLSPYTVTQQCICPPPWSCWPACSLSSSFHWGINNQQLQKLFCCMYYICAYYAVKTTFRIRTPSLPLLKTQRCQNIVLLPSRSLGTLWVSTSSWRPYKPCNPCI